MAVPLISKWMFVRINVCRFYIQSSKEVFLGFLVTIGSTQRAGSATSEEDWAAVHGTDCWPYGWVARPENIEKNYRTYIYRGDKGNYYIPVSQVFLIANSYILHDLTIPGVIIHVHAMICVIFYSLEYSEYSGMSSCCEVNLFFPSNIKTKKTRNTGHAKLNYNAKCFLIILEEVENRSV